MNIIDENILKKQIADWIVSLGSIEVKRLLGLKRYRIRDSKSGLETYIAMNILFSKSDHKTIKGFYRELTKYKENVDIWGSFPTYERFIVNINRCGLLVKRFLEMHLDDLEQGQGYIDSTKIETSRPYWFGKTHRYNGSCRGYSSTGEFMGLKLHAVINNKGSLLRFSLTDGKTHDLTPIKNGLLAGLVGKLYGDSGYVSRDIYFGLMSQNLFLFAKPRKTSLEDSDLGIGHIVDWTINHSKQYRKRQRIERYFYRLKNIYNLVVNKTKSKASLLTRIFSAMLASQLDCLGLFKYK